MKAVCGESRTYGLVGGNRCTNRRFPDYWRLISPNYLCNDFLSEYFDGDELYAFFIFEEALADALSAIHPSQFLFSTKEPGLSTSIGLLDQMWVMIENYSEEDPEIGFYEEL